MKFSIDTQQDIVRNWYYQLGSRAKNLRVDPVKGLKSALDALNLAHELYRLSTKSTWGYIRSFIPLTSAYSRRVVYHSCVITARDKLAQLQANIAKAEQQQKRQAVRASSLPELPKHHPSPIAAPKQTRAYQSQTFTQAKRFIFG